MLCKSSHESEGTYEFILAERNSALLVECCSLLKHFDELAFQLQNLGGNLCIM